MSNKTKRSNKTKKQCYRDSIGLMVNGYISDEILDGYLNDEDGEGFQKLRDYVLENMRGEIMDWSTAIGIIEAADRMYECALENGNL